MFEPVDSWSLPAHLYMVSNWSADCASANPESCVSDPGQAARGGAAGAGALPAAFRQCLRSHGVTRVRQADLTSAKVVAAVQACAGTLTPAQRQALLRVGTAGGGTGNGGGESQALGLYSWTDLTYLLHKANVSWAYYVQSGIQPDQHDHARPGLGLHRDLPGLG
jgi:hypothetical protein